MDWLRFLWVIRQDPASHIPMLKVKSGWALYNIFLATILNLFYFLKTHPLLKSLHLNRNFHALIHVCTIKGQVIILTWAFPRMSETLQHVYSVHWQTSLKLPVTPFHVTISELLTREPPVISDRTVTTSLWHHQTHYVRPVPPLWTTRYRSVRQLWSISRHDNSVESPKPKK